MEKFAISSLAAILIIASGSSFGWDPDNKN